MNRESIRELRSGALLFLAAFIWGFAFVAMRIGSGDVPTFAFNGLRSAIAAVAVLPLVIVSLRRAHYTRAELRPTLFAGTVAGLVTFGAGTFQQMGITFGCTAGKSGFIACLYIVLVPLLGVFMRRRPPLSAWVSMAISVVGLYLISVRENFTIAPADLLVLAGSLFWAIHILVIDRYCKNSDAFVLSFVQFFVGAVLSGGVSLFCEHVTYVGVVHATVPLLYTGVLSSCVAFLFQIVGQRHIRPAHGAVIMSLESFFAAVGGFLILNERLGVRGIVGCALMLAAALFSQLASLHRSTKRSV